jgi:hypothetical protein
MSSHLEPESNASPAEIDHQQVLLEVAGGRLKYARGLRSV